MMLFLKVCWEFFKTGLFAVGGGLATVPFLKEMSLKYGWFSISDLMTMLAVSESTPGPIGINMSTYVGNVMFDALGGIFTTLSLVAPSIIVCCIIAKVLEQFKDSKVVKGIFAGLRPAVVGFILSAVVSIYITALFHADTFRTTHAIMDLFNWKAIIFFGLLLAFYKWKPNLHPIFLIIIAAAVGMVFAF